MVGKNSSGPRVDGKDILPSIGEKKNAGGDFRSDSMDLTQCLQGFFICQIRNRCQKVALSSCIKEVFSPISEAESPQLLFGTPTKKFIRGWKRMMIRGNLLSIGLS